LLEYHAHAKGNIESILKEGVTPTFHCSNLDTYLLRQQLVGEDVVVVDAW
jgi:hypothetical protein